MRRLFIFCFLFAFFIHVHAQTKESAVIVDINYFQAEHFRQGEADAKRYIRTGKAKIYIPGGSLSDSPSDRRRNVLRMEVLKESGIDFELQPGEGCVPDPGREAYARGFKNTMNPKLDDLLGKNWNTKIEKEVELRMKNRRHGHSKIQFNR